jgi:hypothetical protein
VDRNILYSTWHRTSRMRTRTEIGTKGASPFSTFMIRMAARMISRARNRLPDAVSSTIAMIMAVGLASIVHADTVVGSVTEVSGKASVKRAASILDAALNMPIQLHDRLTTGPDGHISVTLTDTTKIDLPQQSVIDLDEMTVGANGARSSTVVTLVGGSVRSFVSATMGRIFNYQTRTSNSIIAVRGTDFEVDFSQGRARPGFSGCGIYTDVKVFSGLVEVANISKPNERVEVSGGFHTTVPCFAAPLPAGPLGLAAHPGAAGALTGAPPPVCPPPGR